jgi:large subunit ribosomal protein L25
MANAISLKAQPRTAVRRHRVGRLRQQGTVPAVLYSKRIQPTNLQVNARELGGILSHATSENLLVNVEIEGSATCLALIQELQHDPMSGKVLHLDLHEIAADEKIHTRVPVEAVGEPIGVKTFGGILEHLLREIEVECLPHQLPSIIEVNVEVLNVGESMSVGDLKLPEGVSAITGADVSVFAVAAPTVEAAATPGAGAAQQPEVISEKKDKAEASGDAAKKK